MKDSEIQNNVDSVSRAARFRKRLMALLPILSLFVVLGIFWWLKLTGITLAGEAFCGMTEHTHSDECIEYVLVCTEERDTSIVSDTSATSAETTTATETTVETTVVAVIAETVDVTEVTATDETAVSAEAAESTETSEATETTTTATTATTAETTTAKPAHVHTDECYEIRYSCGLEEHTHVASCYSDITADIETADDWEATLADVPAETDLGKRIVGVANSQLGYTESELNFTVDSDGVKRGYTRYGEWYGNPYGDWSTMFTSFCLRYAGLEDVPISAGTETMRIEWEKAERYKPFGNYTPFAGDVVFLDKNKNGTADATAIVTVLSDGVLYVIEGDVENAVHETAYMMSDSVIVGFGESVPERSPVIMYAASAEETGISATTVTYNETQFKDINYTNERIFVIYVKSGTGYYAIDGNGQAVQVTVDSSGNVTSDIANRDLLLWRITYLKAYENGGGASAFLIKNLSTGKYIHPCNEGSSVIAGEWESGLFPSGSGVKIRGARQNYYSYLNGTTFKDTTTEQNASVFYLAQTQAKKGVWLDGTNGGLMGLYGSPNVVYELDQGDTLKLPETWQTPDKYNYVLRGWFDVKNNKYYKPGETITVEESLVFYADWWAESYDVGQYNEFVSDTVSTNSFITTSVFDYNSLFNLYSLSTTVSANASSHKETWNMVSGGNVPYLGGQTLDFVFCDYDSGGDISYANNRNTKNANQSTVTSGIYNDRLGEVLFDTSNAFDPETGQGIIGKKYLGTADYLFHFDSDPNSANRGYYYYDSKLNAATYNQSDECFYVYDYLERTSDSQKDGGSGEFSDFLPFNSPYVNTNGKNQVTYSYDGLNGEYTGNTHYQYDAKDVNQGSAPENINTNYWFGMAIDIRFYLSNDPGETLDGEYGNRDLYGNEMHFKFSGDDDLWVLIDGKLVLDVGGVHGIKNGDINFSTGIVTVEGTQTGILRDLGITEGEHTLTVYYLERGSSQSNCAIYFNIAPRFKFTIQKEDVLTRDLLTGAEFTIYADRELTIPAELWTSEEAYHNDEDPQYVFAIEDGSTTFWGLSPGKTYYIIETKPPTETDYSLAHGIICLSLDYNGKTTYTVEIVEEYDENGDPIEVSKGYTVHGFRIDEETQEAFIVITNAYNWVTETTTIQAEKKWNDSEDHSDDSVTLYLTVTYEDGTTKRIREVHLDNTVNWTYTWTNLPKYWVDGVTEVEYGIEEAYSEGYFGNVEHIDHSDISQREWIEAYSFIDGGMYILGISDEYLSVRIGDDGNPKLYLVDRETAKTTVAAQWTAAMINGRYVLTNGDGWILNYHHSNSSNSRWINVVKAADVENQYLSFIETTDGIKMYFPHTTGDYYCGSLNSQYGILGVTDQESAVTFIPRTPGHVADVNFGVTNTPLDSITSVKVRKLWDAGIATGVNYDKLQAVIKLYANGKDTGRTVTLNLKNGWTATFEGLPYTDLDGNVIVYTVEESTVPDGWIVSYGDMTSSGSGTPTYSVTVTNRYIAGHGVELPSTGGYGALPWVLCGFVMTTGSLVLGYALRRKRERRSE